MGSIIMRAFFCLLVGITLWSSLSGTLRAQPLTKETDARYQERLRAFAFPFEAVQLLDSPFKAAMQRDAAYLFSLDPDRLLSRFRRFAGLASKAPEYGGWESLGISGHTLGHYLSALSMYYAATRDSLAKTRIAYIVQALAEVQQAHGNGYVGAIPEGERLWSEIARGELWETKPFSLNGAWVPWYTLHKLFAGLLDAYWYAASQQALQIAIGLADWVYETTKNLTPAQWQQMLQTEHGGMNEVLAHLHGLTGNPRYRELSQKFYHATVLSPLARGIPNLTGLHANTQIPKVIGVVRQYELIGSDSLRAIAEFFWEEVVQHHTYVIGGNSQNEHFGPRDSLSRRLDERTAETCNTYNMLRLTRHLFALNPEKVRYVDYYERALYNHILASQEPHKGMFTYFVSLRPGHFKTYSTPEDAFWCCVGTGMENHVKYNEFIYFYNGDTLYVNLFIPSELTWKERALTVRLETAFPESNQVRLKFNPEMTQRLVVRVRHPSWAQGSLEVRLNGEVQQLASHPGSYLTLDRLWHPGDQLELTLPLRLHVETMPDNPDRFAILYGPIVLAGVFGNRGLPEGGAYARNQWDFFNWPAPSVPRLCGDLNRVETWVKPLATSGELRFHTVGVGQPADVLLKPFYEVHHERYTIYWDRCR